MSLTTIVLVGANGNLGPSILTALLNAKPKLSITVLTRSSSKSTYPTASNLTIKTISDDFPSAELENVFRGQDAVTTTVTGSKSDLQVRIADAAATAGVRRFIPADFGSCDSDSERALKLVPLYVGKKKVREHLIKICSSSNNANDTNGKGGGMSWTSLVCGHFFDYGLRSNLLQFDLKNRRAILFDGGEIKWSTSTLPFIGKAVVSILQHEEETRNRMLYVQSFRTTQREVLKALEKATGDQWTVEDVKSEEFIKTTGNEMAKEPNNAEVIDEMVSVVGIIDTDWTDRGEDFANDLLGLKEEDLDEVVKAIVAEQRNAPAV